MRVSPAVRSTWHPPHCDLRQPHTPVASKKPHIKAVAGSEENSEWWGERERGRERERERLGEREGERESDIWNLATPNIEGCFDIEAFDIEGCFDIEYSTFDIEVFASISKLTKNLRYRRNFVIEG